MFKMLLFDVVNSLCYTYDFEQKIQHCYNNQFFVAKDMRKKNFHRRCLERINLSWFVTTLSSTKAKHLLGILNCRHFDTVCFYGNIMAPIPSRAEINQATLIMRSHFAAVSVAQTCPNDYSIMRHPEMFKFAPTTPNMSQEVAISRHMVAKHTEHVASNNIAICCIEMLQSFGRGLRDNPRLYK